MRPLASRMSVMSGEGALTIFARAKELERSGRSIIHLELGEPDFHPAKSVNDALKRAIDEGKDRYCPVIGLPALREALAVYLRETRNLNISPQNIVIAPGCKIALFMAMMALIDPGDEVLYPDPGFPGYASITLGLGGVPVPFILSGKNHLQPDPEEIASQDHAAHENLDHELAGQSDRNGLHRRGAAAVGGTGGEARPAGALG